MACGLIFALGGQSLAQDAQDMPPPPTETETKVPAKAAPAPPPAPPAAPAPAAKEATPPPAPQPPQIEASAAGDGLSLPDHPDTVAAKTAYNAGKYGDAINHFRSLARRWPGNAAVYRALARACTWDDKPNDAIKAYRAYLELLPDAADREKIQAELDLVLRKTKRPPKEGPPSRVKKALAAINKSIESGRLGGRRGAASRYAKLMQGKYIGPALAQGRDALHTALIEASKAMVSAWWNPTETLSARTAKDLVSAWTTLSALDAPAPRGSEELIAAVTGLEHLMAGRHAEAVSTLAPVAPGDPRLRYAQAIGLLGAKRIDEAKQLLTALARGDADPRVHLALGLVGGANTQPEGLDALHQALSTP